MDVEHRGPHDDRDGRARTHPRPLPSHPAPEFWDHWLDPALTDKDDVDALLASIPEPQLHAYEVSTKFNSPRNNTPDLLTAVP